MDNDLKRKLRKDDVTAGEIGDQDTFMDPVPDREDDFSMAWERETEIISDSYVRSFGFLRWQIESFDKFALTTLPEIIEENSVVTVNSTEVNRCHTVRFYNMKLPKPTVKEAEGGVQFVLPHQCRQRRLTYASTVLVDVEHSIYDIKDPSNKILKETQIYREIVLCKLPIMVRSAVCALNGAVHPPHEIPMDGGYFIVNGNEKAVIGQEKLKTNFPYVFGLKGPGKYSLSCEVRSWHESKMRSTSTLYVYLTHAKDGVLPECYVQVPFIDNHFPLRSVFHMIGCTTTQEMACYILGPGPTGSSQTSGAASCSDGPYAHLEQLVRHILQSELQDMPYAKLMDYVLEKVSLRESNRDKRIGYVEHLMTTEFLPHMGLDRSPETLKRKCFFFGLMLRKLLGVYQGKIPEDDRDDYVHKRVDTTGVLLGLQFRQLYRNFRQTLGQQLKRSVDQGKFINIVDAINPKRITSRLRTALSTGNWNVQKGAAPGQTGVAQVLCRMTPVATLSHLRRINIPINREGKQPKPRQLDSSTYFLPCPAETPEGGSCGLVRNLATMTHIRMGYLSVCVMDPVRETGLLKDLLDCDGDDHVRMTLVFVNGYLMGVTEKPEELVENLRFRRRIQDIPRDVSIGYVRSDEQIHIYTDAGCLMRPVLSLRHLHLIPEIRASVRGNMTLYWEALMLAGAIQWLDKEEERLTDVAYSVHQALQGIDIHSLEDACFKFEFSELNPAFMLGQAAGVVPFPDHNQAPRNMYAAAMAKQAVSNMTAFMDRLDTVSHILHYPQKPLVTTATERLLGPDDANLSGTNVVVMIGCYSGYNQEDSAILNQSSIDRGLFRSTIFRTYKDEEKGSGADVERFERPDQNTCLGVRQANYSKLESDGLAAPGTKLEDGDAIIGKTMTTAVLKNDVRNKQIKRDHSTFVKHNEPCVVDQVWVGTTKDGKNCANVRTRADRVPQVGDKFCVPITDEVLTKTGWTQLQNVTLSDWVLALNPGTETMFWEKPASLFRYYHVGPMLTVETNQISLKCTADHRLWIRPYSDMPPPFNFMTARELIQSNNFLRSESDSTPETETDTKYQFSASGEPDMSMFSSLVDQTSHSVEEVRQEVLYLAKSLPLIATESQTGYAVMCEDGASADELQKMLIYVGWWAMVFQTLEPDGTFRFGVRFETTKVYPVVSPKEIAWTQYQGEVGCLEVSTGIFMLRSNGKVHWTGNSSRHGQKGVVGLVMRAEDLPFTASGMQPDIIINPHAIPSRMTIGQLIECVLGKTCALAGAYGDGTPFRPHVVEETAEELKKYGFERYGKEQVYNGMTGELMENMMFIGPTFYYRLKHMAVDKVHGRARGPIQILTRQPVEGRSRDGGMRFGEMERDCLISHGAAHVLRERLHEQSDKYVTVVCSKCGLLAIPGRPQNERHGPAIRGPFAYCRNCKSSDTVRKVEIPYAFKVLIQELQAMNFAPRLRLSDDTMDEV